MRLVLDLPPRELSPNARVHWARKAKAVRTYRMMAFIAARNAIRPALPWERAEARVAFYFSVVRRRDSHNFAAALKACWDGIVDAGVLADDSGLTVHAPTMAVDRKCPRVEIELTEAA